MFVFDLDIYSINTFNHEGEQFFLIFNILIFICFPVINKIERVK